MDRLTVTPDSRGAFIVVPIESATALQDYLVSQGVKLIARVGHGAPGGPIEHHGLYLDKEEDIANVQSILDRWPVDDAPQS